jgi:hypothetical protein
MSGWQTFSFVMGGVVSFMVVAGFIVLAYMF